MPVLLVKSRFAPMRAVALCVVMAVSSSLSWAQLSSPIAGGVPMGGGPGVHSPNSQFPPLQERSDVLPWSVLSGVKTKVVNKKVLPEFAPEVLALRDKVQRVHGFMMPLDPGEKQVHFLLTSVPLTCPFCMPGGPESMIEVKTKTPVKYTMEPVVVEGKLAVLADDAYGLYYRIADGTPVK